jgi:hypothetical protein
MAVAGLGLRPSVADAQATPTRTIAVRVDYQSPTDCPAEAAFVEQLMVRSSSVRVARPAEPGTRLVVHITRAEGSAASHGELQLLGEDGSEAAREVDGDSCQSVVDALALMSAIALDPTVHDNPALVAPATQPPGPLVADLGEVHTAFRGANGLELVVLGGGGVAFGLSPVGAPSVRAAAEFSSGPRSGWSPSLRFGFDYATSGSTSVPGGSIRVTRSVAFLHACPNWWRLGPFRLAPCFEIDGGGLAASGLDVTPSLSAVRPWFAMGPVGNARYAPSRGRFFVEIEGGVILPVVRDRFFFDSEPSAIVFRAPVVGGFASGAVGLTIF